MAEAAEACGAGRRLRVSCRRELSACRASAPVGGCEGWGEEVYWKEAPVCLCYLGVVLVIGRLSCGDGC